MFGVSKAVVLYQPQALGDNQTKSKLYGLIQLLGVGEGIRKTDFELKKLQ
jgi:hypothetical protein